MMFIAVASNLLWCNFPFKVVVQEFMSIFFFFSIFFVREKDDPYLYEISLCKTDKHPTVAVRQTNTTSGKTYVAGKFDKARVFGGSK